MRVAAGIGVCVVAVALAGEARAAAVSTYPKPVTAAFLRECRAWR